MKENENMFTLAGVLFVITAIVALLLASVNQLTAQTIQENATKEQEAARMAVLQLAETFEDVPLQLTDDSLVQQVYAGYSGEELVGYCVSVTPNGFGGPISMMVGIRADGSIEAVKIVSMSETPGLGSKAQDPIFSGQFSGKKVTKPIQVIKSGEADQNEIIAVAGATVTSQAITNGVNAAISVVDDLQSGGTQ